MTSSDQPSIYCQDPFTFRSLRCFPNKLARYEPTPSQEWVEELLKGMSVARIIRIKARAMVAPTNWHSYLSSVHQLGREVIVKREKYGKSDK